MSGARPTALEHAVNIQGDSMKSITISMLSVLILAGSSAFTLASAHYYHGYYGPGPRVGVIIGDPFWGPPPPPVYYAPPPVVYVNPPQPQVYVQKTPDYAYYCRNPAGWYLQVPRCPSGWMKVARTPGSPQ